MKEKARGKMSRKLPIILVVGRQLLSSTAYIFYLNLYKISTIEKDSLKLVNEFEESLRKVSTRLSKEINKLLKKETAGPL